MRRLTWDVVSRAQQYGHRNVWDSNSVETSDSEDEGSSSDDDDPSQVEGLNELQLMALNLHELVQAILKTQSDMLAVWEAKLLWYALKPRGDIREWGLKFLHACSL